MNAVRNLTFNSVLDAYMYLTQKALKTAEVDDPVRVVMMSGDLDAYAKPPQSLRDIYKQLQKNHNQSHGFSSKDDRHAPASPLIRETKPLDEVYSNFVKSAVESDSALPQPETCAVPGKLNTIMALAIASYMSETRK